MCFFFKEPRASETSLYFKPLNNYPLVTMSKSLYSGTNKAYFQVLFGLKYCEVLSIKPQLKTSSKNDQSMESSLDDNIIRIIAIVNAQLVVDSFKNPYIME